MFVRCRLLALFLGLASGSLALAQSPSTTDPEKDRIEALVQKLGSSKFSERGKAQKELEAIGEPALDALRKAAAGADLETTRRAAELIRKIEEVVATRTLLAPRKVRLNFKDTPISQAIAELSKQSGYPIQLDGDLKAIGERTITLQTGEITFLEALDLLCGKAGLLEKVDALLPGQGITRPRLAPAQFKNPKPAKAAPPPPPGQPPKAQPQPPAQIQVQVQVQGQAQALPIQVKIGGIQVDPASGQDANPGAAKQIHLAPGTAKTVPTCYSGAVRFRILPPSAGQLQGKRPGEYLFLLDCGAEPRLQNFTVIGLPHIDKAIDDQDQPLLQDMTANPQQAVPIVQGNVAVFLGRANYDLPPKEVLVRLKHGEKPAKILKELSGAVTAKVTLPLEPLVIVDEVLKAQGQTVKGKHGGSIEVKSVSKQADGLYKLHVVLESPPANGNNAMMMLNGGIIQIQQAQLGGLAAGHVGGLPELEDSQGKKFQIIQIPNRSYRVQNGVTTQDVTLVYRGAANLSEPVRLILTGQRETTVQVPFIFHNVPLR